MTQEIRTITIGAGQARPRRRSQKHTRRRVRLNGWTVAKYAALTVAGVLLFRAGAAYALTERGYKAIGGEVFALFLPVFYYRPERPREQQRHSREPHDDGEL